MYSVPCRNLQNHNRHRRVHQLWSWNVLDSSRRDNSDGLFGVSGKHLLDNNSRHSCRNLPLLSGQLRFFMQWLQCNRQLHLQHWLHRSERRRLHSLRCRNLQINNRLCRLYQLCSRHVLNNGCHNLCRVSCRNLLDNNSRHS